MYLLDTPIAWALGFQDSGSLISRGIYELHDYIMFYLILIFILKRQALHSGFIYILKIFNYFMNYMDYVYNCVYGTIIAFVRLV